MPDIVGTHFLFGALRRDPFCSVYTKTRLVLLRECGWKGGIMCRPTAVVGCPVWSAVATQVCDRHERNLPPQRPEFNPSSMFNR